MRRESEGRVRRAAREEMGVSATSGVRLETNRGSHYQRLAGDMTGESCRALTVVRVVLG